MAPIPIFSEETLELILAARRIQADLIDVQIPRLRSCEGPLSLQQSLAAELREDTGTFEQQIAVCHHTTGLSPFMLNAFILQELDLCVDDQPRAKSQAALRDVVAEFKDSLSRCAVIFPCCRPHFGIEHSSVVVLSETLGLRCSSQNGR